MESLAINMANLMTTKKNGVKIDVASVSSSPLSGGSNRGSKVASPGVNDGTTETASSEEETSAAESGLSADEAAVRDAHLKLLRRVPGLDELNEIQTAPLFTESVRKYAASLVSGNKEQPFSQYGLLAGDMSGTANDDASSDPRIFWNIAAPSSFFICGSQGSGKSHTLSCLLENALAPCSANVLPRPLTGIVFHYDTFISDSGGSPCEAAWLSSNRDIKVRVLCPPTNIGTMRVSSCFLYYYY